MDKRKLTKKIVDISNTAVLGAVTKNILETNTRSFTNPYAKVIMTAACVVTSWSVRDVVLAPVKVNTDKRIDALFDSFESKKTTEPTE